jgi:hypothetical protein
MVLTSGIVDILIGVGLIASGVLIPGNVKPQRNFCNIGAG